MINPRLGIIGGGQLGSMLCQAAKKINIETTIFKTLEIFSKMDPGTSKNMYNTF